jgi:uncharacterized repeat protein (TIGR01451 family)
MTKKPATQTGRLRLALALAMGLAPFLLWLSISLAMRLPVAQAASLTTVCLEGFPDCQYTSIQAAVDAAIPGDVIKVAAGTYTGVNNYGGSVQMVYISKTVTIQGGYTITDGFTGPPDPAANPTTLDALELGRVVYITSNASITIENLSLTNGTAAGNGGGIYHAGDDLILNNTTVFSNAAALGGGGVYIESGNVTLNGAQVLNSSALFSGGGIYNVGGVLNVSNGSVIAQNRTMSSGFGGGIQNRATLTVTDSTVRDNYASNNGGGVYNSGTAAIANSTILSNTMTFVGLGGGGVFNSSIGVMTVDSSTIAHNVTIATPVCAAKGGGIYNDGTLTITDSTINANEGQAPSWTSSGGGIFNGAGSMFTSRNNTISNNSADTNGGGIFSDAGSTFSSLNSTISGNSADAAGGGMYISGTVATLTGTTISGNSIGDGSFIANGHGGGIVVVGGSILTITNSTISGNSAADDGGGLYNNGATVSLINVTVSDNTATSEAGGIDNFSTVYLKNTIIAGNTASGVNASPPIPPDCRGLYGALVSQGYNLIGDTTGCSISLISSDLQDIAPALGPLADNGGGTETHALLPGSPAIDTGTCGGAPVTDQRGVARPQGASCDIGAYEAQACFATPDDGATVYDTAQEAVDAASPGGTVKVAGYCSGVQMRGGLMQTVYVSKTLTVRGGYTPTNWTISDPDTYPTTLDALGLGRVMVLTGTIAPTVEGLRITGGDAYLLGGEQWGDDAGGGVYVYAATATISNCVVYSNTASSGAYGDGGGIYLYDSPSTLIGNTVTSNTASTGLEGSGGGLALEHSDATLEDNTVQDNIASTADYGYGGGISLWDSDATLEGNTVRGNVASTVDQGQGGGIYSGWNDPGVITLTGNTVYSNIASAAGDGYGGGICLEGSPAILIDNTVISNTASTAANGHGGGVYIDYVEMNNPTAMLTGNTVQNNIASTAGFGEGGGVWLSEGYPFTLTNNTVISNTASTADTGYGGGIYLTDSTPILEDNTIHNNVASVTDDGFGGGIHAEYNGPTMFKNNTVVSNTATLSATATGQGGGMWAGYLWYGSLTMTNNLVAGNHATTAGSGLYVTGDQMGTTGQLLHNTIADNTAAGSDSGQGVYVGQFTTLVFTNTIIAGHTSVGITVTDSSAIATLEGTLWHDNGLDAGGAGTIISSTNVYGDPAFADPASWDYHLTASSAAIDTGVDAGVTTDFEGGIRPQGDGFDIGYDESPFTIQADVAIVKTVTPGIAAPNQVVTYTLTFTNTGPLPALGVFITDAVPITLTNVSYNNAGAAITPTGSFSYTWKVADLAPSQGGVITITGIVATSVNGVLDLYNQAEITTTIDDPIPLNNISIVSSTIDAEPPTPPTLLSPADGILTATTSFTLTWSPSPSADVAGYLLDLDGTVTDVGNATDLTTGVLSDGTYTWTLAAYDTLGNTSTYTDTWSFTIDTTPPTPPTLLSPADGTLTNDNTPTLTWSASPSADVAGYLLDLDGSVSDVGNTTSFTATVLADGTYTWTLAAYDTIGNISAYVKAWSFTVDITPPPPPTLLSPADGILTATTSLTLTWNPSLDQDVAGYLLDLDGTVTDVGNATDLTTGVLSDGTYTWTLAA